MGLTGHYRVRVALSASSIAFVICLCIYQYSSKQVIMMGPTQRHIHQGPHLSNAHLSYGQVSENKNGYELPHQSNLSNKTLNDERKAGVDVLSDTSGVASSTTDYNNMSSSSTYESTSGSPKGSNSYEDSDSDIHVGCQKVHFSSRKLPLTCLASFPGSGNTWVRHLLQEASGIYSSSVYSDRLMKTKEFKSHVLDGSATPIKTHKRAEVRGRLMPNCKKTILILRNPYDTIKAEFNRKRAGKMGQVTEGRLKGWRKFVKKYRKDWLGHALSWIVSKRDLFVIKFQDLKTNLTSIVDKACDFLQVDTTDAMLDCVQKNQEGSFHRKKSDDDPDVLTFSSKQTGKIDKYLSYVTWYLNKRCPNLPDCLPRSKVNFNSPPYIYKYKRW